MTSVSPPSIRLKSSMNYAGNNEWLDSRHHRSALFYARHSKQGLRAIRAPQAACEKADGWRPVPNSPSFSPAMRLSTRPWSRVRDTAFLSLIEKIRASDVSIANLETVIHDFEGHAQADSGG